MGHWKPQVGNFQEQREFATQEPGAKIPERHQRGPPPAQGAAVTLGRNNSGRTEAGLGCVPVKRLSNETPARLSENSRTGVSSVQRHSSL